MREILFRGKSIKDGSWLYGCLMQVFDNSNKSYHPEIVESLDLDSFTWGEVIHETVGQYTGLTLNGVKLFEGDLFKLTFSDGYTVTKVIRYIFDKCQFCVANINDLENEQYWDIWSGITKEWLDKIVSRCEIIGNIHDVGVKQ